MILISVLLLVFSLAIGYMFSKKVCDSVQLYMEFTKFINDAMKVVGIACSGVLLSLVGFIVIFIEGVEGLVFLGLGFGIMVPLIPINKGRKPKIV